VTDDARTDGGASAFRGFLFSDVRGFTAFAERYGNAEAAAMVARFLDIARTAISRHEGAEIKTEGDAIHAVFPSASGAVLCGLEIVDAAAALNAKEPGRPLGLGVGVHAGDAVETAEGYIGSAVNLASRLCAAAQPGEVLVTATVKNMTQSSIPVGYMARGRRRLKGIREPVEVFAATHDLTARTARAMNGTVVGSMAALGAAVLVAIAITVGSQVVGTAKPSPSEAVATARPVAVGSLPIGTYTSVAFQPALTFTISTLDWSASADTPDAFGLLRASEPLGGVQFLRVGDISEGPCTGAGEGPQGTPPAAEIVAKLQGLTEFLTVTTPQQVKVGGLSGQLVEITVSQSALAACGGLAGAPQDVSLFTAGAQVWGATPGERFRLIAVDVGDKPVTILISADWTQPPSVQQLEAVFGLGQSIVQTVRF
jgi:class 3 adenylate cyclase